PPAAGEVPLTRRIRLRFQQFWAVFYPRCPHRPQAYPLRCIRFETGPIPVCSPKPAPAGAAIGRGAPFSGRRPGQNVGMAARPLWSGTISFGLVSIPVRMFSATQSQELRFHFVDRRDLAPVGYDKVRKDTGEHVDPDEIVR